MKFILYLWQLPQNLLGVLIVKITHAVRNEYDGTYMCERLFNSAVSLGDFIIFQEDCITTNSVKHEKGHQKQSKMFGLLYLPCVGLPSIVRNIWDRLTHKDWLFYDRVKWYYSSWPEKQADDLGGVNRF
jgi:hypothetical protein